MQSVALFLFVCLFVYVSVFWLKSSLCLSVFVDCCVCCGVEIFPCIRCLNIVTPIVVLCLLCSVQKSVVSYVLCLLCVDKLGE